MEGFREGRISADRMVEEVCRAYYSGGGGREVLQPIIEVVERVSPGKVRLTAAGSAPGYELTTFDRAVPKEARQALRAAVDLVLAALPAAHATARERGFLGRVWDRVRRLF